MAATATKISFESFTATSHPIAERKSARDFESLIKEQIELGDLAAEEAGMPYYRKAGGFMEQARPYVKADGKETFENYCTRVTKKSWSTCKLYIDAHRELVAEQGRIARLNGKKGKASTPNLSGSLSQLRGTPTSGRVRREYQPVIDDYAERARQEQERRTTEQRKKQDLARRLIGIGFKVLSQELHPDKGGSDEAQTRLNEIRKRLMQVYG